MPCPSVSLYCFSLPLAALIAVFVSGIAQYLDFGMGVQFPFLYPDTALAILFKNQHVRQ
jgi:hypothetical protein